MLCAFLILLKLFTEAYGNQALGAHLKMGNITQNKCLSTTLATRSGNPTCYAKIDDYCIGRALWLEYLSKDDSALCGAWTGRWRSWTKPRNDPEPTPAVSNDKPSQLYFAAKNLSTNGNLPTSLGQALKSIEKLRDWLSQTIANADRLGILRNLLLSERTTHSTQGLLRILGFVHLFTATGIHLYALAQLWSAAFQRIAGIASLPVGLALWINRIFVFLTWSFAWCLAGARAGMVRPWIIVLLRKTAKTLGFRWQPWAPLIISIVADLGIAITRQLMHLPGAWAPGRWIYALAVGGGMMAANQVGRAHPLKQHLALAVGSWIFVAIWETWQTHLISVVTPILSLITLPLFCFLIYPAHFVSIILHIIHVEQLAQIIAQNITLFATKGISILCHFIMSMPSLWLIPRWALASACIIVLIQLWLGQRWLWAVVGVAILVRIGISLPKTHNTTIVEQLDVGQGDAALVTAEGEGGMIDSGAEWALTDSDWLNIFTKRDIKELKWVALTHLDADHSQGLLHLARLIPIHCVVTSKLEIETPRGQIFSEKLKALGITLHDWNAGCIPFPFLPPQNTGTRTKNDHMGAILVPLEQDGFYLSAGDATKRDEIRIAKWAARELYALHPKDSTKVKSGPRILKISHHGSKTSTTSEFLRIMQPTEAWISVGPNNLYGHPHLSTLAVIQREGIPIFRTDRDGILDSEQHPQTYSAESSSSSSSEDSSKVH